MIYLLIVALVSLSALFSASEISFSSLNKVRLERLASEGSATARMAKRISDHYDRALAGIIVGNNLVNIATSSVATMIAISIVGESNSGLGATVASAIIAVIILIFGEIAPKIFGKKKSIFFARFASYPIYIICMVILAPFTFLVLGLIKLLSPLWKNKSAEPAVTEDDLATMIETAEEEEVLDEDRSELLQSALGFSETTAEEILVPRINIDAIDIDDDFDTIMKTAMETHYSRLIVYRDTIDHVIGVLYLNHFFKAVAEKEGMAVDIAPLLLEPCYIHKTMKLPAVLSVMREAKAQIAVILDEYGGTLGIVTVEDILEEIVGDIWDESDDIETEVVKTGDDSYDVDGMMNIYDFFDYIDFDEKDFDSQYTTMGGWAIEMLDADPHVGDSFGYRNLYVIVTEMNDNIVTKLSVQVKPEESEQ